MAAGKKKMHPEDEKMAKAITTACTAFGEALRVTIREAVAPSSKGVPGLSASIVHEVWETAADNLISVMMEGE